MTTSHFQSPSFITSFKRRKPLRLILTLIFSLLFSLLIFFYFRFYSNHFSLHSATPNSATTATTATTTTTATPATSASTIQKSKHQTLRQDRCKLLANPYVQQKRPPKPEQEACPGAGTPLRILILTVVLFGGNKEYQPHIRRLQDYSKLWGYDLKIIDDDAVKAFNLSRPPPPTIGKRKGRTVKWNKVSALIKFSEEEWGYDYIYWTDIDNMIMDKSQSLERFIDTQQEVGLFLQEKNHQWRRMFNNHAFIVKCDTFGRGFVRKWFENSKHGEGCLPDQMTMFGTVAEYFSQFVRDKKKRSYKRCWDKFTEECHKYNLCFNKWMIDNGFGPGSDYKESRIFFYEDRKGSNRLSHNRKIMRRKRKKASVDCESAKGAFSVHAVKGTGSSDLGRGYPFPCKLKPAMNFENIVRA